MMQEEIVITDLSIAQVLEIFVGLGEPPKDVWIEYQGCGTHEVVLRSKNTKKIERRKQQSRRRKERKAWEETEGEQP